MPPPVVEQIAAEIARLISLITTANGFNQDLTATRPKRIHLEGDLSKDKTVMIQLGEAETRDEDLSADGIYWSQMFELDVYVVDSDDSTEALDTRINTIRADIEKQLCQGANFYLAGLAQGIYPTGATRFTAWGERSSWAGATLSFKVLYTTDFADPFTQS